MPKTYYHPFGLNIQTLSPSFAQAGNNYQYNGKELNTDFGLHWNDYGARWYDAQVARWWSVDPLGEHPNQIDKSAYAYAWDNPITLNDPDGKCPWCPGAAFGAAVEYGGQVLTNLSDGKTYIEAMYTDVDFFDVGIAAFEGGVTGGASVAKNITKKAVISGVTEFTKSSVNMKPSEGFTHIESADELENSLKAGGSNIVGNFVGGKMGDGFYNQVNDKALKSAKSQAVATDKNLNKAYNVATNGNKNSKSKGIIISTQKRNEAYSTYRNVRDANTVVNVLQDKGTGYREDFQDAVGVGVSTGIAYGVGVED